MTNSPLKQAWLNLSPTANEAEIAWHLIIPEILKVLGFIFDNGEVVQQYTAFSTSIWDKMGTVSKVG